MRLEGPREEPESQISPAVERNLPRTGKDCDQEAGGIVAHLS